MTAFKMFLLFTSILFISFSCKKECLNSTNCSLTPDGGLCNAAIPKYYFEPVEGQCKMFIWGGCGGIVPFNSIEECEACECNN